MPKYNIVMPVIQLFHKEMRLLGFLARDSDLPKDAARKVYETAAV